MKTRSGFTLVEVMISLSILSLVLFAAASLTVTAGRSFDLTSAQLSACQSASIAVENMNQDLREAKQVTITSATEMVVYYPQLAADGTYIHNALDTVDTVTYYRGWSDGTADPAGDSLLRLRAGGTAQVMCSGVTTVQFVSSNPSSVDITLDTQRYTEISSAQCNMVHRAIFLRNY
jgi:prepilin-type N-terminal cleavage/methylation domain-containing protein